MLCSWRATACLFFNTSDVAHELPGPAGSSKAEAAAPGSRDRCSCPSTFPVAALPLHSCGLLSENAASHRIISCCGCSCESCASYWGVRCHLRSPLQTSQGSVSSGNFTLPESAVVCLLPLTTWGSSCPALLTMQLQPTLRNLSCCRFRPACQIVDNNSILLLNHSHSCSQTACCCCSGSSCWVSPACASPWWTREASYRRQSLRLLRRLLWIRTPWPLSALLMSATGPTPQSR